MILVPYARHSHFVRRLDLGERWHRCATCGQETRALRDKQAHAELVRQRWAGAA